MFRIFRLLSIVLLPLLSACMPGYDMGTGGSPTVVQLSADQQEKLLSTVGACQHSLGVAEIKAYQGEQGAMTAAYAAMSPNITPILAAAGDKSNCFVSPQRSKYDMSPAGPAAPVTLVYSFLKDKFDMNLVPGIAAAIPGMFIPGASLVAGAFNTTDRDVTVELAMVGPTGHPISVVNGSASTSTSLYFGNDRDGHSRAAAMAAIAAFNKLIPALDQYAASQLPSRPTRKVAQR